jgi:hypothetical protein
MEEEYPTYNMDALEKIFTINKKSLLESHCKKNIIYGNDFFLVIWACEYRYLPWSHQVFTHGNRIPKHLSESIEKSLMDGRKEIKGFKQIFMEGKAQVGHMFYLPDFSNWHFIFFDRNCLPCNNSHWKCGPHIHLVNHLWPNYKPQTLWDNFTVNATIPPDSLHIRYVYKVLNKWTNPI